MATAAASEAARAVNSLLRLSSNDQDELLEVLEGYFTSPEDTQDQENLDDLEDSDGTLEDSHRVALEGIALLLKQL